MSANCSQVFTKRERVEECVHVNSRKPAAVDVKHNFPLNWWNLSLIFFVASPAVSILALFS